MVIVAAAAAIVQEADDILFVPTAFFMKSPDRPGITIVEHIF